MDSSMDKSFADPESPPSYVSQRVKNTNRIDSQDPIIMQLNDFRQDIKEMMTAFTTKNEKELKQVTTSLKVIQQSNVNIENSVAYLTAQNEEFKKKINQLESQVREDKKYITVLENKIEEIQLNSIDPN